MFNDDVEAAILATASEGVSHIGFIAFDVRNHVLVCEPEDQPFGVTATLPRVRVKPGETPAMTLRRCLKEKVGYGTTGAFPIPSSWVTENSTTFYFTGMVHHGSDPPDGEVPKATWLPQEAALTKLRGSKNPVSRNRDLAALVSSVRVERSLFRRILLMVRSLHRMGFGRLRAAPWMHQNGYIKPPGRWSCSVVPLLVMSDTNGALTDGDRMNRLREALGVRSHHDPFETLGHHRAFGWDDALFDTPERLAEKFFERFRDLCFIGWGSDPEYEEWLETTLGMTAPNGVFYPVVGEDDHVVAAYALDDCWLRPPPLAAR
jgi:hypothetical protein